LAPHFLQKGNDMTSQFAFLLSPYFSKSLICSALRSVFSSSVMLLVASSPRYIRQNTYCEFINTINQDLLLLHGINRKLRR
jgi:hypothetical protein